MCPPSLENTQQETGQRLLSGLGLGEYIVLIIRYASHFLIYKKKTHKKKHFIELLQSDSNAF